MVYEEAVMRMMVTAFNRDSHRLADLQRQHVGVEFVMPEEGAQAPALWTPLAGARRIADSLRP